MTSAARRATANRERVRRHRKLHKAGFACYEVPIHEEVLDAMTRRPEAGGWGWLLDREADDPRQVAKAIAEQLLDAARNSAVTCNAFHRCPRCGCILSP
jgi:hypothetical protein